MGQELEDDLDSVTGHFVQLNDRLEESMALQARVRHLVEGDDPCAAVMVDGLSRPPGLDDRPANALLGAALIVRDIQTIAANTANKLCSLDITGFNTKPICALGEAVRGVAIIVATALEIKRDNINSETLDISFECIKVLDQMAGMTTAQLMAITGKVRMLEMQLANAMQELSDVTDLVRTPPGHRSEFPNP